MSETRELLNLAARLRECARQTALDDYAAQMLRAAAELEAHAAEKHQARPEQSGRTAA